MTKYRLAGFVTPAPKISTFLIPFFSSSSSNYNFAQELNRDYTVNDFLQFNPADYEILSKRVPFYEISIGEPGVLAVTDLAGQILHGTYRDLTILIEELDLEPYSPFFKMEAYTFLNKENEYTESCDISKLLFDNNNNRNSWYLLNIKKYSARNSTADSHVSETNVEKDDVAELVEYLSEIFEDRKWHNPWRQAWEKYPRNKSLLSVASKWLKAENRPSYSIAQVLISILRSGIRNENILNTAELWLSANNHSTKTWPTIWILLNSDDVYSEPCFSMGLEFLGSHPGVKQTLSQKEIYNWSKIWSKIYQEGRHSVYLLNIVSALPDWIEESPQFNKFVILTILRDSSRAGWAITRGKNWLRKFNPPESLWFDVFAQIVEVRFTSDMQGLLVSWFNKNSIGKTWFRLWNKYGGRLSEQEKALVLRRTLLKGSQSSLWASLMTDLLHNPYSTLEDRELAYRWLHQNSILSYTKYFIQLENTLLPKGMKSIDHI